MRCACGAGGPGIGPDFAAIAEAVRELPVASIVLDGEGLAHCDDGLPDLHGLRSDNGAARACLYAVDLLMLEGRGLPEPTCGNSVRENHGDDVEAPLRHFSRHRGEPLRAG